MFVVTRGQTSCVFPIVGSRLENCTGNPSTGIDKQNMISHDYFASPGASANIPTANSSLLLQLSSACQVPIRRIRNLCALAQPIAIQKNLRTKRLHSGIPTSWNVDIRFDPSGIIQNWYPCFGCIFDDGVYGCCITEPLPINLSNKIY